MEIQGRYRGDIAALPNATWPPSEEAGAVLAVGAVLAAAALAARIASCSAAFSAAALAFAALSAATFSR